VTLFFNGPFTVSFALSIILSVWRALNVVAWMRHWDPYPFILLNLALTFQAAYAVPIIMMSQNRLAAKDRLMAEQDYQVNTKAEEEVKRIMQYLEQQDEVMIDILRRMEQQDLSMTNASAAIRSNGDRNPRPA
jgi:uncharacterized membrane protein